LLGFGFESATRKSGLRLKQSRIERGLAGRFIHGWALRITSTQFEIANDMPNISMGEKSNNFVKKSKEGGRVSDCPR
jgi:hypothetical protein